VGSLAAGAPEGGLIWADILGAAWLNARPIARYLAFMVVAGVIACAWGRNQFDVLPSGFNPHEVGVLGSLTTVNNETIAVALAAGVAGMLALETRASSAVVWRSR